MYKYLSKRASHFAVLALVCAAARPVLAVSNFCPFGTCDIANPIYINVFWDQSLEKWNSDIAATDIEATVGAIDALTEAICRSAYFSDLDEYSVKSCHTKPGFVDAGCGKVPANLDEAHDRIGQFASCVVSHHPEFDRDRTILNVFLPPQTKPVKGSDFCANSTGEHDKYGSPVAVTFNMTNSACHGGIAGIVSTLTHEMVEAATDPLPKSPTGWKELFLAPPHTIEVADQCENKSPNSSPFLYGKVALYFSDLRNSCTDGMEFQPAAKISRAKACGSGSKMKITLDGVIGPRPWDLNDTPSGVTHSLFLTETIDGKHHWGAGKREPPPGNSVGIGRVKWSHATPPVPCSTTCEKDEATCMAGTHDSGERSACVKEKTMCLAECKQRPDPKAGDTIVIHGFDDRYNNEFTDHRVAPGDKITVAASSYLNGTTATATVVIPEPNRVQEFAWHANPHHSSTVYVGDSVEVTGKLVDKQEDDACGEEGIELTPKSDHSADSFYPEKIATGADGRFDFQFTVGGLAGTHRVKIPGPVEADLPIEVHPIADQLSVTVGDRAGGRVIQLNGTGFDKDSTKIRFESRDGSANATDVKVLSSKKVQLTTPPSPNQEKGNELVKVVAIVNDQESAALSYRYIVPNRPVLDFTAQCRIGGGDAINSLFVSAFNADGSTAQEAIALSATDAIFVDASGHFVSRVTVQPGTNVQMKGVGPISATGSALPGTEITAKFTPGPPCTLPTP